MLGRVVVKDQGQTHLSSPTEIRISKLSLNPNSRPAIGRVWDFILPTYENELVVTISVFMLSPVVLGAATKSLYNNYVIRQNVEYLDIW